MYGSKGKEKKVGKIVLKEKRDNVYARKRSEIRKERNTDKIHNKQ